MSRNSRNAPGPSDRTASVEPARTGASAWLICAVGTGLASLALLVMAGMAAYGVASGGASTTTRALTEAAVLVVLAVGVGLLSFNLLRRKSLAKTPTILWNGLLVPVAFSLMNGGAKLLGIATLVVAAVTFFAALTLPRFDPDEEDTGSVL